MRLTFFYALLLLATVTFSQVNAQQTAKVTPKLTGYLEYLPQGYNNNSDKYPIVISLHGIKEKGTTSTNITDIKTGVARVANVGLPKYVKYGAQYPFILISPQLKSNMGRWTGDYVMEVLNYVKTYLRVDPNRVYLTGLSLGGGGVWSVATAYPSVWASILPICSGYNVASSACKLASVNLPVWGFHGDADNVVGESVTINMINAINNCSPKCNPLSKVTIFPGLGHVIWDKVYKETSALNWMLSFRKGSTSVQEPVPSNAVPVANAGSNKSITLPTNSTSLAGSATDSDGTIASYTWTKKSGSTATMSGATTKTLALSNLVAGTYVFTLTVKDDKGATDTDDVTVTVNSSTTNTAPIANAGTNVKVLLPATSASIKGSATDKEGNIASYSWTKVSGGSVSMSGTTSLTLNLSGLQTGNYVFRLTVKDTKGLADTDDVLVTVSEPPVVTVGADRTVTLPLSSLSITGTATDDGGSISYYRWYKVSGPSVVLNNSSTKTVTLTGLQDGTYVIKLVVKDNLGLSAFDEIKITVKAAVATIEPLTESGIELAALFMPNTSGLN